MALEPSRMGPKWFQEWTKNCIAEIKRCMPINGTSIQVNDSESGRVVNWMPPNPGDGSSGGIFGGGNGSGTPPFELAAPETLEPGSSATATWVSEDGKWKVKLGIPRGDTGEQGEIGPEGATGPTGPKGDTGNTGATGPKGDKGDPGEGPDSGTATCNEDGSISITFD